jgi:hypothetical protein
LGDRVDVVVQAQLIGIDPAAAHALGPDATDGELPAAEVVDVHPDRPVSVVYPDVVDGQDERVRVVVAITLVGPLLGRSR